MKERLVNLKSNESSLARLDGIRLSARELAEARVQMMRAEAIADVVYDAWVGAGSLVRRVVAAVSRKAGELANAYAESALRAGARKRDEYLAQATDTADLEHRFRMLEEPRYVPLLLTRA